MLQGRVLNPGPLVLETDALPTAPDSLADQESNLTIILLSLLSFDLNRAQLFKKRFFYCKSESYILRVDPL